MYFTHRTGHGIGMEGHEEPYMRGDNMQLLEPGMAYTVEPGIYIQAEGIGVRIENDVILTDHGVIDLMDGYPIEIDEIESKNIELSLNIENIQISTNESSLAKEELNKTLELAIKK